MIDQEKLKEAFSDKEYVESIAKMSAEDAAKSLNEKGVDVTADDLMQVRDFLMKHKDELQSGELSEESLAEISGGASVGTIVSIAIGSFVVACLATAVGLLAGW